MTGEDRVGRNGKLAFWLGAACTAGFYALLQLPQLRGGALERYTAHHITEYITVALFFWGMCDLLCKFLALRPQWRALERMELPANNAAVSPTEAGALLRGLHAASTAASGTLICSRLQNGLSYVAQKNSAEGLEEHLKYLTDVDAERSHAGYSLVRFIAWVTPILGFLGTVVHFTLAISQVTPEQLEHSLSAVTTALGVAFDTTALALSLSIVVMFFIHLVERNEKDLLHAIEMKAHRALAHRFTAVDAAAAPFIATLQAASEQQRRHLESLVERQARIWAESLADVQRVQNQNAQLQAEHWTRATSSVVEMLAVQRNERDARISDLLDAMATERSHQHSERGAQTAALAAAAKELGATQTGLQRLGEQLTALLAGTSQLREMEQHLNRNLEALKAAERLDEAVHSLSAAIHLLTARKSADWRAAA